MIHGIYHFGKKRTACRNDYCTVCQAPTLAEGRRSFVMLHFLFVPVIPMGFHTRWFCTTCGMETIAKQPNRPALLIVGVVFGVFMMVVGTTMLLAEGDPAGWLGVGMGMIVVFSLLVGVKRQKYDAYLAAKRAVVPLRGDECPFCHAPVLASITPRCHACQVRIATQQIVR